MIYTSDDLHFFGKTQDVDWQSLEAIWRRPDMPIAIWHSVENGIQIGGTSEVPSEVLRMHVFGEGGDFTLRMDEGKAFWRYVGLPVDNPPTNATSIWEQETHLISGDDRAEETISSLLWGEYEQGGRSGIWHDDRVGAAKLVYPVDEKRQRITVVARVLRTPSYAIAAYWTLGVE